MLPLMNSFSLEYLLSLDDAGPPLSGTGEKPPPLLHEPKLLLLCSLYLSRVSMFTEPFRVFPLRRLPPPAPLRSPICPEPTPFFSPPLTRVAPAFYSPSPPLVDSPSSGPPPLYLCTLFFVPEDHLYLSPLQIPFFPLFPQRLFSATLRLSPSPCLEPSPPVLLPPH